MTIRVLIIIFLSGLICLISCNCESQSNITNFKELESFFWTNKENSLENIQSYTLKIILNNTLKSEPFGENTTNDTAFICGQNSCFFSSTKQNRFYTDEKYFIFFYPDSTSMYGISSKDKTMKYYNNIIRVLIHCKENMKDYTVETTKSHNIITINLVDGNDLRTNKIVIKATNNNDEFKIKNISYYIKSNTQTSETSIDILDYCFNNSNCIEKWHLSPANFYTESGEKILLTPKYANYKLNRIWQR